MLRPRAGNLAGLGYLQQVKPEYRTSDIRFQTGLTELSLGQLDAAEKELSELIEDDDQYASAYPALATALTKQHKYQQALKVAQEGLAVDQYNEQLYAQAAAIVSSPGKR